MKESRVRLSHPLHTVVPYGFLYADGRGGSSYDNAGPQLRVHGPRLINSSLLIRLVVAVQRRPRYRKRDGMQ